MDKKNNIDSERIIYFKRKARCYCGNLYIRIGIRARRIYKISFDLRNSEPCKQAYIRTINLLINLLLNKGVNTDIIIKELVGIKCYEKISKKCLILPCTKVVAALLKICSYKYS